MPVDFDSLVLRPAMDTFAVPLIIKPLASQPLSAAYPARGVWSKRPIDLAMEGGAVLSAEENKLGIRLNEFLIPPAPGDHVLVDAKWHAIDDVDEDGQGGAVWSLKLVCP